jgi:nitrous oxide reductase
MNLTADLVDQFVDATKDEEKKSSDGIVYGTVVKDGDATYVQLDGSSTATPVSTTMNVKHGDRVTVLIKNHTATITGNYSYPADSTTSTMTSINSFNMAVGTK